MFAYLNKAKDVLAQFDKYTLQQVPRDPNSNADALAKIASAKDVDTLNIVPIERLFLPSRGDHSGDLDGGYVDGTIRRVSDARRVTNG